MIFAFSRSRKPSIDKIEGSTNPPVTAPTKKKFDITKQE